MISMRDREVLARQGITLSDDWEIQPGTYQEPSIVITADVRDGIGSFEIDGDMFILRLKRRFS